MPLSSLFSAIVQNIKIGIMISRNSGFTPTTILDYA